MTSEWDGTSWGGTTLLVPDTKATVKAISGPFAAHVEFGTYLAPQARTPQAMMARAQAAYHTNPWIGSAEATVTRRVAGLPWHLEDENDEEYEEPFPAPVKLAWDLLERPQKALPPELRDPGLLTRRALIALTSRHIGLCGMSYWYLDQTDANGIPAAILYVNPARVWATTTTAGKITGWILDPSDDYGHGGTPLTLAELLPFYLDPPDRGAYGTGLYERAIQKANITNLADRHSAYVLGTGGRLAGIVSPKEGTIPDDQYKTLVAEFRAVNEAPDAAKRTTILRGPIDFTQTAGSPEQLDLIEMGKVNRDDIFAVWGVPPTMSGIPGPGGLNSGETRKYDEAVLMQGPVHDRVVAIREVIQFGLLDRWQEAGTTIDLEIEEPEFDDRSPQFSLAKDALNLPLTNAERRELIGFDPFGDPRDEEVWLPALQVPAYTVGEGKAAPRRQFLGLRRTVETRWVPKIRSTIAEVLAAQRRDVAAKLRATSPATLARQHKNGQAFFDRDREAKRLTEAIRPVIAGIASLVGNRTNDLLAKPAKADPFTDSIVNAVLSKIGGRITGITQTTQEAVAAAVLQGYDDGLSPSQIGDLIEGLPAFDEARAEMVARTETMFAYNVAALDSYNEFGVTEVEAIDGDEDEECAARDGQVYSVEEAAAIEDHPNGTLDWVPVFKAIPEAKATGDEMRGSTRKALADVVELMREDVAAEDRNHQLITRLLEAPPPVVNVEAPRAPVVNVPTPVVNIPTPPAPVVNVPAPIVNVDLSGVSAAIAELKTLLVHKPVTKTVERDELGRISRVVEA